MSVRFTVSTLCFAMVAVQASTLFADTKGYAVLIGNNATPQGTQLKPLRYADDDAERYWEFFRLFTEKQYLLTVPDETTQARYPSIVSRAQLPNESSLRTALQEIRNKIRNNRSRGDTSVVYFTFSGHGARDASGAPYLSLLDSKLTQQKLAKKLKALDADYVHLFMDACYTENFVSSRGMFDNESDGVHTTVSREEAQRTFAGASLNTLPSVGILTASSADLRTHEWTQVESGVFTHEILSGLQGPADVNLDGIIEYSELSAFISTANRMVSDPRGKVVLIAKPPSRNRSIPLVDLRRLKDAAFLVGNPKGLGHFFIELDNGQRYLDANLDNMGRMHIVVPINQRAFLYTETREALLAVGSNRIIRTGELLFDKRTKTARGSLDEALDKGLFQVPYGMPYYLGYIDSVGLPTVSMNPQVLNLEDMVEPRRERLRLGIAAASFGIAGGTAIAAVLTGILCLRAEDDFNSTAIESEASEAADRYKHFNRAFWITAGIFPAALLTGILVLPKHRNKKKHLAGVTLSGFSDDGSSVGIHLTF